MVFTYIPMQSWKIISKCCEANKFVSSTLMSSSAAEQLIVVDTSILMMICGFIVIAIIVMNFTWAKRVIVL